MIILDIVNSQFSNDPFTDIFTISLILVSKSCQASLLVAVGHFIFLNAVWVSTTSCLEGLGTGGVFPGPVPPASLLEKLLRATSGFSRSDTLFWPDGSLNRVYSYIFSRKHIRTRCLFIENCVRYCMIIPIRELMLPSLTESPGSV